MLLSPSTLYPNMASSQLLKPSRSVMLLLTNLPRTGMTQMMKERPQGRKRKAPGPKMGKEKEPSQIEGLAKKHPFLSSHSSKKAFAARVTFRDFLVQLSFD